MYDFIQAERLLEEKKLLLLDFEGTTQQMLTCPAEHLEDLVEERRRLIDLVDQIDSTVENLCGQTPDGTAVREAISNSYSRSGLPEDLQRVYDASMAVKAVLFRLQESDLQAAIRLRLEQERVLEQIKSNNQGVGAKAARFYSFMGGRNVSSRLGQA